MTRAFTPAVLAAARYVPAPHNIMQSGHITLFAWRVRRGLIEYGT
jgi:hypothetical protein